MRVLPETLKTHFIWLWPSFALGALGVSQLHSYTSGQVQGLLNPTFHPMVLLSGIFLSALALLRVLFSVPPPVAVFTFGTWSRILVSGLFIALVLVFEKTTPRTGYSALAFDNKGFSDQAMPVMSSTFAEHTADGLPADGKVLECEVVDLLMAASDPDLIKGLEGRQVRFIGQYLPLDNDSFQVVRFMMYCCAADAQPVGLQIKGQCPGLQKMDWIQIDGVVHFIPDGKLFKVDLHLDKVSPTPTPKETFLY